MYLSAYNFAHTPCVSITLLTYSFSTLCSDTQRWLGFPAGTNSSCVIHFHHHVFSVSIPCPIMLYLVQAIRSRISSRGACRSLPWRKAWALTLASHYRNGSGGFRRPSVKPSTSIRRRLMLCACILVLPTSRRGPRSMYTPYSMRSELRWRQCSPMQLGVMVTRCACLM